MSIFQASRAYSGEVLLSVGAKSTRVVITDASFSSDGRGTASIMFFTDGWEVIQRAFYGAPEAAPEVPKAESKPKEPESRKLRII